MPITGGCRCGAVTYRLTGDALPTFYACHCRDCQTWSGSAFAQHALLGANDIKVDGETTSYKDRENGQRPEQFVCGRCHTRIFNTTPAAPGMVVLMAGTLDASDQLTPAAHIWVSRMQRWIILPTGVPTWQRTPTPQQFAAAVQAGGG